jgi:hypothetical protein
MFGHVQQVGSGNRPFLIKMARQAMDGARMLARMIGEITLRMLHRPILMRLDELSKSIPVGCRLPLGDDCRKRQVRNSCFRGDTSVLKGASTYSSRAPMTISFIGMLKTHCSS